MERHIRAALLIGAALLFSGAQANTTELVTARPASPPPYCQPVAYRDYEVLIGRAAALRPAPGCTRPSLVRKISNAGTTTLIPVPLPTAAHPLVHVWLFLSRLEYTLDGVVWRPLRLTP